MKGYPEILDTTFSNTQMEYLDALLHGGKCLGYENLAVTDVAAVGLDAANNFPSKRYALLYIEANAGVADPNKVIRWREDGTDPTAAEGMPIGDNSTLDVKGSEDMVNFKMIGIDAALAHSVKVVYYGKG